ncbi:30S ribosomal protein S7 [Candidatus Gracilibacteria bacterium]|nr:30S ribosomal protein S7 [Candidatus Gracilibacteria bacterium]
MTNDTKVAAPEVASQNSEKDEPITPTEEVSAKGVEKKEEKSKTGGKVEKKINYQNSFSYTDPLQTKVVNCLMRRGKKSVAQRILQDTFDELFRLGEKTPLKTFEVALQNATPTVEVRAKRIGGAVYQIPVEVATKRQQSLSIRWILQAARARKGRPMYKRLAQELLDASQEAGSAVNKKKEAHKMAQANKAFAHLARY